MVDVRLLSLPLMTTSSAVELLTENAERYQAFGWSLLIVPVTAEDSLMMYFMDP